MFSFLFDQYTSRARLNTKDEKFLYAEKTVTPSPQIQQLLMNNLAISNIGDSPSILLTQKASMDRVLANISRLEESLNPIVEVTKRLDRILSGSQSKGALGEQLIGERLAQLPHDWVEVNTTTGFALRAPNGRSVPIYSKWTSTELLDQLGQTTDNSQQDVFKKQIRSEVRSRAQEALKYLDKDRTLGFCIVAVPDSVFELCLDVQTQLTASNIVLISYSLLVPYILLIVNLFLKNAQSTQVLQVSHILSRSVAQIELIQRYIDTQVKTPLDTVRLQQAQYSRHNQQLQQVYQRLNQIQSALTTLQNSLPNGINPLSNADIASIPRTLNLYLSQLQEGLLESDKRQDGSNPDDLNK